MRVAPHCAAQNTSAVYGYRTSLIAVPCPDLPFGCGCMCCVADTALQEVEVVARGQPEQMLQLVEIALQCQANPMRKVGRVASYHCTRVSLPHAL